MSERCARYIKSNDSVPFLWKRQTMTAHMLSMQYAMCQKHFFWQQSTLTTHHTGFKLRSFFFVSNSFLEKTALAHDNLTIFCCFNGRNINGKYDLIKESIRSNWAIDLNRDSMVGVIANRSGASFLKISCFIQWKCHSTVDLGIWRKWTEPTHWCRMHSPCFGLCSWNRLI